MTLDLASRGSLYIAVGLLVVVLLGGCGAEESGQPDSSETMGRTAGTEMGGAQSGLGPEVEKIMGSS